MLLQRLYPKRCSSTSAEIVANIEELLTEILLRVPATPLLRFKCVSKRWLSLISNPTFCHRHTLQNPHSSISAVFSDSSENFSFIPFPPPEHDPSGNHDHSSPRWNPLSVIGHQYGYGCIRIIQSCNGLFLCQPLDATTTSRSPYFVLNPTTNKFLTPAIPPCPAAAIVSGQQVETHIIGCSLAFDPSRSSHYKVICLDTIDGSRFCRNYQIQIYSSETRSWRLLSSSISRITSVCYNQGVYSNGAIHWVGDYCEMSYYHIDEERVEFVDTTPHCLQKKWSERRDRYFMESSGGRLHLMDYDPRLTKLEVLEMGRDYSGWFVKYNVHLDPLCTAYPDFIYGDYVVLFLDRDDDNEQKDNLSLMLHTPGKVISCNLKSKTFKSFELATDQCYYVYHRNFLYKETLADFSGRRTLSFGSQSLS